MEINAAGFGSVGYGHVLWLKELIFFAGKMEVIWLILLQIVLELAGEIQKVRSIVSVAVSRCLDKKLIVPSVTFTNETSPNII